MPNYADRDPNFAKFTGAELDSLVKEFFDPSKSFAKVLLYGEPGSTKTTEAFSVGNKVLGLIADPNGYESLYNHPELGLTTGRIKPMYYRGLSQLEALAQAIVEGHKAFREFDTVVLDTASNMVSLDLDLILKVQVAKKDKLSEDKKFDYDRDMRGVYNQDAFRARNAFLKIFLAPVNVIATAHVRKFRDKHDPDIILSVGPKFPPEVMASITSFTTMVGYMKADAKVHKETQTVRYVRTMQVHPTINVEAKTRIGGLPLIIRDPSLKTIIEDWQAKGGQLIEPEINDPVQDLNIEDLGLEVD